MSFQARMSISCAETLSSFLITAAQRFEENAQICRAHKAHAEGPPPQMEPGRLWCPPAPEALERMAQQFDKQARQARRLAEQFSDAYDVISDREFVDIVEGA